MANHTMTKMIPSTSNMARMMRKIASGLLSTQSKASLADKGTLGAAGISTIFIHHNIIYIVQIITELN